MYGKTSLSEVLLANLFFSKEKRVNGSTIPGCIYSPLFMSFDCCFIQKKEIVANESVWKLLIAVVVAVAVMVAVAVIVIYYREYIILLCYLYYFIMLKVKIKSLILNVM